MGVQPPSELLDARDATLHHSINPVQLHRSRLKVRTTAVRRVWTRSPAV